MFLFRFFLASRLFVKVVLWTKSFPDPDEFKHSLIISVIIHGSALAILNIVTYGLWFGIAVCGNVAHQFLFKLTQFPISASVVLPAIQKFPITVGIILISMANASCGSLPLIIAVIVYFILIAKMYEDYLEEFVFNTAKLIAQKLFGRKDESAPAVNSTDNKSTQEPRSILAALIAAKTESSKPVAVTASSDTLENVEDVIQTVEPDKEKNDAVAKNDKSHIINRKIKPKKTDLNEVTQEKNDKELLPSNQAVASTSSASGSENSFELLYNQLDPEDIIDFDDNQASIEDVGDEEDEEKKLERAKSEAGKYLQFLFRFSWAVFILLSILQRSMRN